MREFKCKCRILDHEQKQGVAVRVARCSSAASFSWKLKLQSPCIRVFAATRLYPESSVAAHLVQRQKHGPMFSEFIMHLI